MGEQRPATLAELFKNRDYVVLMLGSTISRLGDGISNVALVWFAYDTFKVPGLVATISAVAALPEIMLLLFGGMVSDVMARRHVMVAAASIQALSAVSLGILTTRANPSFVAICALMMASSAAQAFFGPASKAMIPDLLPQRMLLRSNALDQLLRPLALRFIGPPLGGAIIAALGVGNAFFIDAFSFICAILCILSIRSPAIKEAKARVGSVTFSGLKEGLAFVARKPPLNRGVVARSLAILAYWGPFQVLVPYLVKHHLGGNASELGIVMALGGGGAILGATLMAKIQIRHNMRLVLGSWCVGLCLVATYALAPSALFVGLISGTTSFFFTVGNIAWAHVIQLSTPSALSGRVWSIEGFALAALTPLSYVLASPVNDAFGTAPALAICGLTGSALVAVTLWPTAKAQGPMT